VGIRALAATLVLIALFLIDSRTSWLDGFKTTGVNVVANVYALAAIPKNVWSSLVQASKSEEALIDQIEKLESENLVLHGRLQQMVALRAENTRLRALLNSAPRERSDLMATEIVGVAPNPNRQIVTINQGENARVYIGQPLVDAEGVLGQVIEVADDSAYVLLITDPTHSLPVQSVRSSIRGIAEGTGASDRLQIKYLATTTDIEVGDVLVTSGLGGRFPMGYPVASVTSVERQDGERFAMVWAKPLAQMNRARYTLLVFPENFAPARASSSP